MSYVGGDTVLAFLKEKGAAEDHDALKHVALSRIAP